MQPSSCFVNSFACCILPGRRTIMFAWRWEQIRHGGGFLKVHLSSHVARQIFMSGQVPLAVLAAYTAQRCFSSHGQLVGLV